MSLNQQTPMKTNLELPNTSPQVQTRKITNKELHCIGFSRDPEYFLEFEFENRRIDTQNYIEAQILAEADGFHVKLPEYSLQERFFISQKYRTHIFAVYAALQSEPGKSIEFQLSDKRIFDYFDKDLPKMIQAGRLNPSTPLTKKNEVSNADILLPALRLFSGRSVFFSYEEHPDPMQRVELRINQFGDGRLHDWVYEANSKLGLQHSESEFRDSLSYPELQEPVQKMGPGASLGLSGGPVEIESGSIEIMSSAAQENRWMAALTKSPVVPPLTSETEQNSSADQNLANVQENADAQKPASQPADNITVEAAQGESGEVKERDSPSALELEEGVACACQTVAEGCAEDTQAVPEMHDEETEAIQSTFVNKFPGISVKCTVDQMSLILSTLQQELQQKTVFIARMDSYE